MENPSLSNLLVVLTYLVGEHTDYNNGFVLPAAINKVIGLTLTPNGVNKGWFYSVDMNESFEIDLQADFIRI